MESGGRGRRGTVGTVRRPAGADEWPHCRSESLEVRTRRARPLQSAGVHGTRRECAGRKGGLSRESVSELIGGRDG
jgi:hypothetical protein